MSSSITTSPEALKKMQRSKRTARKATVGPTGDGIGINLGVGEIGINTDGNVAVSIGNGPLKIGVDTGGGFTVETPLGGIDYNADGSGSIESPLGIAKMEVEKKGCVYIKRTYIAGTLIDTEYQQIPDCKEDPPDPPDPDIPKHPEPPGTDENGYPIHPPIPSPPNVDPNAYVTAILGWVISGYHHYLPYAGNGMRDSLTTWVYIAGFSPYDEATIKETGSYGSSSIKGLKRESLSVLGDNVYDIVLTINEPGGSSYNIDRSHPFWNERPGMADLYGLTTVSSGVYKDITSDLYSGTEKQISEYHQYVNSASVAVLYVYIHESKTSIVPGSEPEIPIEKPPPPPPKMSNCCKETKVDTARLEEALERIEQVLATREILNDPNGYAVPNKMLIPGGDGYSFTKNYPQILTWLFASIDRYGFDGPIIVDIPDVNKDKEGNQQLKIQVNTLSTAIQTLLSLAVENKGDQASRLNIQVRLAFMLTRMMRMTHKMYYLIVSILEGIGVPTIKKRIKDIPFEFNLNPDDLGFGAKAEKLDTMNENDLEAQLPKLLDTKTMDLIVEVAKPGQLDIRGFLIKLINKN